MMTNKDLIKKENDQMWELAYKIRATILAFVDEAKGSAMSMAIINALCATLLDVAQHSLNDEKDFIQAVEIVTNRIKAIARAWDGGLLESEH